VQIGRFRRVASALNSRTVQLLAYSLRDAPPPGCGSGLAGIAATMKCGGEKQYKSSGTGHSPAGRD